eukprot:8695906-Pyramimonas_sp.AAC.1
MARLRATFGMRMGGCCPGAALSNQIEHLSQPGYGMRIGADDRPISGHRRGIFQPNQPRVTKRFASNGNLGTREPEHGKRQNRQLAQPSAGNGRPSDRDT